jgi:hypothetical protein
LPAVLEWGLERGAAKVFDGDIVSSMSPRKVPLGSSWSVFLLNASRLHKKVGKLSGNVEKKDLKPLMKRKLELVAITFL